MTSTILLTGFGAFGEVVENPSMAVVEALAGQWIAGRLVVGEVLPVEYQAASDRLRCLLEDHAPELVLCLGVAAARNVISLERIAINLMEASIPDNAGIQPMAEAILKEGPSAYFSTLPIEVMKLAIEQRGVPVEVSLSAGAYVCNRVFYELMHLLAESSDCCGGFVHLPPLGSEFQLGTLVEAIRAAIFEAMMMR